MQSAGVNDIIILPYRPLADLLETLATSGHFIPKSPIISIVQLRCLSLSMVLKITTKNF